MLHSTKGWRMIDSSSITTFRKNRSFTWYSPSVDVLVDVVSFLLKFELRLERLEATASKLLATPEKSELEEERRKKEEALERFCQSKSVNSLFD